MKRFNRITSFILAVFILVGSAPSVFAAEHPFADVPMGCWFEDPVEYMYRNNFMNGVSANQFAPNYAMNRAMVVTVLYRMEGEPAVGTDEPFADVPAGEYYTDPVAWARAHGIVHGTSDSMFSPADDITREQMITVIYRYVCYRGFNTTDRASLAGFSDYSKVSGYAVEAMQWAVEAGLITGTSSTTLAPNAFANRAQCATVFYRLACWMLQAADPTPEETEPEPTEPNEECGHPNGVEAYTAPTCEEYGYRGFQCPDCGYEEQVALEPVGHDYAAVVTAPTCTAQGYATHTCHCGDNYVDGYTAALGHDWDSGVVTVAPTEDDKGEMVYTCQRCAATRSEMIPELEHSHSYTAAVTAPTCVEQGYTTHICRCGDSYVDTYVDALGHDMGTWTVMTVATCVESGLEIQNCSRCDHSKTRPIGALGHDWDDGMVTIAPTEGANGEMTYTCQRCNATKANVIPKLEHSHSYDSVVTAPTCIDQGFTTHICHCGDSFVDTYVGALGHDMGEWNIVIVATCTENGLDQSDCTRCDHSVTRVVEATGHDYQDGVCTICGDRDPNYQPPAEESVITLNMFTPNVADYLGCPAEDDFGAYYEQAVELYEAIIAGKEVITVKLPVDWPAGLDHSERLALVPEIVQPFRDAFTLNVLRALSTFGFHSWTVDDQGIVATSKTRFWSEKVISRMGMSDPVFYYQACISAGLSDGMSQREAVTRIGTWICDKLAYGTQADPVKALNEGTGSCNAYSLLFLGMCQSAGIDVQYVCGCVNINEPNHTCTGRGCHAWNRVEIDGIWKHSDVCWGDCITGDVTSSYFLQENLWADRVIYMAFG